MPERMLGKTINLVVNGIPLQEGLDFKIQDNYIVLSHHRAVDVNDHIIIEEL